MSLQDLEEHGVLLPEEERGEHELSSTTPHVQLLVASALAVVGCVLMYLGNGNRTTFIGLGVFFGGFGWVVWSSTVAIDRQRARVAETRERLERRQHEQPDEGQTDAET